MSRSRIGVLFTSLLAAIVAALFLSSSETRQARVYEHAALQPVLRFVKSLQSTLLSQPLARKPDTTAVVLNWSRLPNVVRIASLLCEASLDDVMDSDFSSTGCSHTKLKIHNSPENLYFQARFIGCAEATTEFCFIQDDDYIIWPHIIQTLHARMKESDARGIHLLPAHEHLSSTLQTIVAPPRIHTDFAWLGHGAIIRRSLSTEFLSLLDYLKANDEEQKMADNYFTILSNAFTERWFDQGYELGGGQAFTVGTEGDLRNERHIARATKMLDDIFAGERSPCEQGVPYVDCSPDTTMARMTYAPCKSASCLFQTNIQLLPDFSVQGSHASELAQLTKENSGRLGIPALAPIR
ncbi:hypothetical protein BD626DRAFT_397693 [Schizophyllum amplum]|uniref:Glycosyltransferase family 31 protein n=1 Tax=Schizophyllum amplum TaxID=97359 RepID=A0A550CND1_9AGAR|nr:hypothetical protein BD626DRAFT_397693 [Auriculariopsis ampla]